MYWQKHYAAYIVAVGLLFPLANVGMAQCRSKSDAVYANTLAAASDGHDFDFELGTWNSHTWRRSRPLTGSSTWDQYDGVEVVRKVANGAANLGEFHADGPADHLDGMSLLFYDASARCWTLYYFNPVIGAALIPATGAFTKGKAEFYDEAIYNEKAIVVRSVWSGITPNAYYFERSFSADGGRTWEVNWITTYMRSPDATH
jgi:hypothetical protein